MKDETDEDLVVEFVRTGSRGAFAEIYGRYKDKVFNTAYRIVGDYEGARDVAHDVFVKVYVEARGFRFRSSFSSWIYRIAINRSLDESRRNKRRRSHTSMDAMGEELPSHSRRDQPDSVAMIPTSPKARLQPRWAMPRRLPFCSFLHFTLLG